MTKQLKAVGVTCGIGSMLIGARQAGFKVLGNIEWRKYYHHEDEHGRNTFTENFPEATFPYTRETMTEEEFRLFSEPDLAIGHPECGKYSLLDGANKKKARALGRPERNLDAGDIPLFVDLIAQFKPRYFVMDDLPGSFAAFPMEKYAEKLPDYDLFPEWISNWGYGNVQKKRNRMFMLGARKSERWTFIPGEVENTLLAKDVIEDLGEPRRGSNFPNHDPHAQDMDCFRALNLGGYRKKNTWAETTEYFKSKRGGHILKYIGKDGQEMVRIGFVKAHWDGPAHTLTGGNACMHHIRCEPYTIRERARIQGFPDDFVFYGTHLDSEGRWHHDANLHMVKQTGKAMPIQFCRYVSEQIAAKIEGRPFESSRRRILPPNILVDEAKRWYCGNVGYADQESACGACWMASTCEIRTGRYGYPPLPATAPQRAPRATTTATRTTRTTMSQPRPKPTRKNNIRVPGSDQIIPEKMLPTRPPSFPTGQPRPSVATRVISFDRREEAQVVGPNHFDSSEEVVVRNPDRDEAGDYRVATRADLWAGKWPGWEVVPGVRPADLD
jgi:site-specific DNA-cytosine methylase